MAVKKSFKNDNPAMRFISPAGERRETEKPKEQAPSQPSPAEPEQENAPVAAETGVPMVPMKRNPLYIETRSRRLNLLVQPTLHTRIKMLAESKQTSVNDLIHLILEEYAAREGV